ncbi:Diacylglycerol kinase [Fasciola hepatica]|uniref:Diacylglycerol kinase n=1 Tax=Fasciola hepatica TaxID=6192 RepID=A0A4E0RM77_FASHE|nr:Diacylglycerol kinase [Fasciola hepatica]
MDITNISSNNLVDPEVEAAFSGESVTDEEEVHSACSKSGQSLRDSFQGHSFVKKNLHKPATCHHCSDLLWGILGTTGMVCEVCNFLVHEKCMRLIISPCTCIVPFLIKDPVPHCWSEIGHFKRKFCNVCRKRVDDLLALRCEICEYYSHYECLDFASADCKQCALSSMTTTQKLYNFGVSTSKVQNTSQMNAVSPLSRGFPSKSSLEDYSDIVATDVIETQPLIVSVAGPTSTPIPLSTPSIPSPKRTPGTDNWSGSTGTKIASGGAVNTVVDVDSRLKQPSASGSSGLTNATLITNTIASTTANSPLSIPHMHHWREGNLPMYSKCMVCRKTCWSAECLTGFRCEWCGTTVHCSCFKNVSEDCDFGVLRDIMLPPGCVSLPRTSLLVEQIIGMTRPQPESLMGVQSLTDEFSSSGDSPEESGMERRSVKEKVDRDFDDYVRVYDGLARYRKRQCRYLSLGRSVSVQKVIELSLKAFQLPPDEAKDYCLIELNEKDGSEHSLHTSASFKSQLQYETRRPQIILRFRDRPVDRDFIHVYPGTIGRYSDVDLQPISLPIMRETTSQDVISMALKRFGLEHLDPSKFQLVETVLDRGLTERVMPIGERIWSLLDRVKRESVRALRLTRFYVQPVEDSNGPGVALFVGNLKKGLSQRLYERILLERLGVENRWDFIEVIYYDFGSLVIVYLNPERADEAYHILKQSTFEDRPILAMILPRLQPADLPNGVQPLLVLVNVKSGGCQGIELITSFRKLLNPHQVFNLDYGGPLPGLHCFRHLKRFKILVCGGDGTVGWALSCLDNVGQDAACPTPPMAILPLGTGNDLARVLRWGSGYTGGEEPLSILRDVVEAEKIRLDRWTVVIKPDEAEKDAQKKQLQIQANAANTNEDTSRIFVMNNYFGLGIDADLNLDFHMAREENPAKFNSRIHNKSVYLKMGLRKMVNRTKCKDLHQNVSIEVDGKQLDLPPLEGIIILNILSWGAGANPWGVEKDDAFSVPTHYDGQLEVVGVTGVVHMGQIFSGLRTGTRLAQGGHIRITVKNDIPVQVDGEPWIQSPGQIIVLRSALKATMLKKRKRRKVNRRHTEPGLGAPSSPDGPGADNLGNVNDSLDSMEQTSSSIFGASGPPPRQGANEAHTSGTPLGILRHTEIEMADLSVTRRPQLLARPNTSSSPCFSEASLSVNRRILKVPLIPVPSDPSSGTYPHCSHDVDGSSSRLRIGEMTFCSDPQIDRSTPPEWPMVPGRPNRDQSPGQASTLETTQHGESLSSFSDPGFKCDKHPDIT